MAQRPRSQPQNRSREEIIAQLLENLLSPSSKTTVMNNSRVSFTQLQSYLDILQANRLAEVAADGMWIATDLGRKYLEAFRDIREVIPSTIR